MVNNSPYDNILGFWFGRVEDTIIPSENRARVWFGDSEEVDNEIKQRFTEDLQGAISGDFRNWEEKPHGQLALIIMLDQFSRHIYRNEKKAYEQDKQALAICTDGLKLEADHQLSLIERVFFYFPLLHSEKMGYQEQSIRSYQLLKDLAFAETRVIYDSFLKFANHHYTLIQRFGRFPQRNEILGRRSTPEELDYLSETNKQQSQ